MSSSLVRNTLLYLPAQFLAPLTQFVVLAAWTHSLSPADFGVVAFVVAAQEFSAVVGLTWWTLYVLRYRQRHGAGEQGGGFGESDSALSLAGAAVQAALAPLVVLASGAALTPELVGASGFYLVSRLWLYHYSEWARSLHRIGLYTAAQFLGPISGSLLSLVVVEFLWPTASATLGAMAAGQCAGVALLWIGLRRWPAPGRIDRSIVGHALRFGGPIVFSAFFLWISVNGVRVLVQIGEGIATAGLLAAGWSLGLRVANVLAMLCTVAAFPLAVDRMEAGDGAGAMRQIGLNGLVMLGLLAPAVVGVDFLAAPLTDLLIAETFRETTRAILPIAMATGALRMLKTHIADQSALLAERTGVQMSVNFLDAAACAIGAAVGLRWGVVGAALGCMAGTAVGAALMFATAVLRFGLPLFPAAVARVLGAAALMGVALEALPEPGGFVGLTVYTLAGAALYALALLLVFPDLRRILRENLQRKRKSAGARP